MNSDIKQKLHALVDSCNDDFLLEEAKAVLESNQSGKEFWNELSDEDKELFEAEEEHEEGHAITHNRLMHQFEEWKKKKWSETANCKWSAVIVVDLTVEDFYF